MKKKTTREFIENFAFIVLLICMFVAFSLILIVVGIMEGCRG